MHMYPKEEKTLVLIKPDGVKRGLTGEIMRRIEQCGLKIIAIKMVLATRDKIDGHYPKDPKWVHRLGEKSLGTYAKYGMDPVEKVGTADADEIGKKVRGWILDFMTSGPIIKIAVQGVHAINVVRKICGNSLPNMADVGTIRGDFSVDSPALANSDSRAVRNVIHASETPEEAEHELAHWFSPEEIHSYKRADEDIMF